MKIKTFTGAASDLEASIQNFMNTVENFQLHSISFVSSAEEITAVLFYTGNEIEAEVKPANNRRKKNEE